MDTKLKTAFEDRVAPIIPLAELVAFDECHKIYLAMDEIEAEWFRDNYPVVVEGTAEEMYQAVVRWFDESCFLRFVSAVRHNAEDPNAGFAQLIPQGFEHDDEDDEDDEECICEIPWTGMDEDCPAC